MKSLKLFLMRELRCSGVLHQGLRAGLTEPSLFGAYKEHSVHLSGVDDGHEMMSRQRNKPVRWPHLRRARRNKFTEKSKSSVAVRVRPELSFGHCF